ncbi:MAG: general secretion pathway protein GspK [Candidatus Aminicenantes bacterium]|nr:MAG: general secretion pathway protein GspK [Candidatus Aminicenantes bacterium]
MIFIVLVFIIAMTTLVWITTMKVSSEADFLESELSRLRAYTLCMSGFEFLKNRLSTGRRTNIEFLDGRHEPHSPRLLLDGSDTRFQFLDIIQDKYRQRLYFSDPDQMGFIINLQDSAGLINVFKIDRTLFKNLLEYHGFSPGDGDIILDSLFDWMDKDSFSRAHGAESDYYLGEFGYSAANHLVDSVDELLLVRGMDRYIFEKIGKLLDFTIGNQGLNPNTMPAEVFYLFKGIDAHHIELVMEKRLQERGIEGVGVMTLVSGYNFSAFPNAFQFFTSNTTYVKIKAQMDEERFFYIMFRLDKVGGGGSMRPAADKTTPEQMPREDTAAVEDFNRYYHIYNWQEGTEWMEW